MPSLIRVWGWAQIWVVLKGPQMVLTHSQSTAGPHPSLEHFHPHPRLPMVGWSTAPKLLSPAQLSSLSPGYKFSHFLNISTRVIHRSLQLGTTNPKLMSSCPQPASAPGAPARMNPLHLVTQTKGRLSYGPTTSNLAPTEFSKRCGPERAPKAPHSPHNSASDSSLHQKPPDIPPNHPPHCSQSQPQKCTFDHTILPPETSSAVPRIKSTLPMRTHSFWPIFISTHVTHPASSPPAKLP